MEEITRLLAQPQTDSGRDDIRITQEELLLRILYKLFNRKYVLVYKEAILLVQEHAFLLVPVTRSRPFLTRRK